MGVAAAVSLAWSAPSQAYTPVVKPHPHALWRVVHDLCVPARRALGLSAPCAEVDLHSGYAVLADPQTQTQVLLVPTRRLEGIESPSLLEPGGTNYWDLAWRARRRFEARAGRPVPRDDIALAVNSQVARSQDQLHIHIDCVAPEVKSQLKARESEIGSDWSTIPLRARGQSYRVLRLSGADLGSRDPFKILARDWRSRRQMGLETLVVIGAIFADGAPGFFLLNERDSPRLDNWGFGEALMDHRCRVLGAASG